MRILALLLIATPFLFGAMRAVTTSGADVRYILVALATFVGAWAAFPKAPKPATVGAARVGAGAVAAIAAAAVASVLVGARSVVSVSIVAVGFGVCIVAGMALLWRVSAANPGRT